jgi:hypothetical protein
VVHCSWFIIEAGKSEVSSDLFTRRHGSLFIEAETDGKHE